MAILAADSLEDDTNDFGGMEVDEDAVDDFLSPDGAVRQRASEALHMREKKDPLDLVRSLILRLSSAGAARNGRLAAAVLLRKVMLRHTSLLKTEEVWSAGDEVGKVGLGKLILESWTAVVRDSELRRLVADVCAAAATMHFRVGQEWPGFGFFLAEWCANGAEERSAVLYLLETLRDEVAESVLTAGEGDESLADANSSFMSLLSFLQDHGGALSKLLAAALEGDGTTGCPEVDRSRSSASRLFVLCVTGHKGVPASLRHSVRGLSATLARSVAVGIGSAQNSSDSCCEGSSRWEACFQAVALAARQDAHIWTRLLSATPGLLPSLTSFAGKVSEDAGSRAAALAAALELYELAEPACDPCASPSEPTLNIVAAIRGVLIALPSETSVDSWAEGDDDEPDCGGLAGAEENGEDLLFDGVLDAAERLSVSAEGSLALSSLVTELLSLTPWQAKHGALLLSMRLGFVDDCGLDFVDGAAATAVSAAFTAASQYLNFGHPRVRWAALEVWCRLFAGGILPPPEKFDCALEAILATGSPDECYLRVRRRAMFLQVLILATAADLYRNPAQVGILFDTVLIPQAASADDDIRGACANIAEQAAVKLAHLGVEEKILQFQNVVLAPRVDTGEIAGRLETREQFSLDTTGKV